MSDSKYYHSKASNGHWITEIYEGKFYTHVDGRECTVDPALLQKPHYTYDLFLAEDRSSITSGSGCPWSLPQTKVGQNHVFFFKEDGDVSDMIQDIPLPEGDDIEHINGLEFIIKIKRGPGHTKPIDINDFKRIYSEIDWALRKSQCLQIGTEILGIAGFCDYGLSTAYDTIDWTPQEDE